MNADTFVGIVGRSGVGKSTVCRILARDHGYTSLRSATTREPRPNEGWDEYMFVDEEQFQRLRRSGELLEQAQHGGEWYGLMRPHSCSRGPYCAALNADGVRDLVGQGGFDFHAVALLSPSPFELLRRNCGATEETAKAWRERRDREGFPEDIGWLRPVPLHGGTYSLVLVNRESRQSAAWIAEEFA